MISESQPGDAAAGGHAQAPTLTPRQRETAALLMRDTFYELNGKQDDWPKLKEIYLRRFDQFIAKLDQAGLQITQKKP